MPPKSKPKGLKASKRAAPFDPSSVSSSSADDPSNSTASNPSVALNKDQTMPLDEDCLTVSDLFELRQSVLDICYPFPHSLALDPDPDRVDEARSLLRGILHGCAVLEPFAEKYVRNDDDDGEEEDGDSKFEEEKKEIEKRRKDAGFEKLKALGIWAYEAQAWLITLQSFALQHLGELFESASDSLQPAAAALARQAGGGGKRRKIDLNEPQSRLEWLKTAHERSAYLDEVACPDDLYDSLASADEPYDRAVTAWHAQHVAATSSYVRELVDAGKADADSEEVAKLVKSVPWEASPSLKDELMPWGMSTEAEDACPYYDATDVLLASLRSKTAWIGLLEAHPQIKVVAKGGVGGAALSGEDKKVGAVAELEECASWLGHYAQWVSPEEEKDSELAEEAEEKVPYFQFLLSVVQADALAARFILLEDEVEQKYRPDSGSTEDDEEGEVTPLPMDAEEVKKAKEASEEAIKAVRATISAHAELPKEYQHPEGKVQQYRKLEELLLVSSALINPSDVDATKAIEREVEEVRKDGGLEQDDGEGEGEEGEGEGEGEK
ncbi:hypothetical protein JCM8547_002669 [Rhodosporidiobolus lusitaniae]